jgi:hypothetical protein
MAPISKYCTSVIGRSKLPVIYSRSTRIGVRSQNPGVRRASSLVSVGRAVNAGSDRWNTPSDNASDFPVTIDPKT